MGSVENNGFFDRTIQKGFLGDNRNSGGIGNPYSYRRRFPESLLNIRGAMSIEDIQHCTGEYIK